MRNEKEKESDEDDCDRCKVEKEKPKISLFVAEFVSELVRENGVDSRKETC